MPLSPIAGPPGATGPSGTNLITAPDGSTWSVVIDNNGNLSTTRLSEPPTTSVVLPTLSKPVLSQPAPDGLNYVVVAYSELTPGSGAYYFQSTNGTETVGPYGMGAPDAPDSTHEFPAAQAGSGVKIRAVYTDVDGSSIYGAWSEISDPWTG